jgi:hypothetical protein
MERTDGPTGHMAILPESQMGPKQTDYKNSSDRRQHDFEYHLEESLTSGIQQDINSGTKTQATNKGESKTPKIKGVAM